MSPKIEPYDLILDLRNALAAAMRVLAKNEDGVENFLAQVHRIGIKDGLGKRADNWLKHHEPLFGIVNQWINEKP